MIAGNESEFAQEPSPPPGAVNSPGTYVLFGLSLPERALRSGVGLVGGVLRESAQRLVPAAFQDSKTYTILVRQTLDFLAEDIGGAARPTTADAPAKVDNFAARKAVGNFVELAGLATVHLSPMLVLAIVSDVAYGSQQYLRELGDELKRQGVIDEQSSIDHAQDLLRAVGAASGTAASAFDTPPLSVEGIRDTIEQTRTALKQIDPQKIIPQAELNRMWKDMHDIAGRDGVGVMQLSTAMTLYSLDKIGVAARGALSTVKVAGLLADRLVFDHYRAALADVREKGFYRTLSESSGPYIEAVWRNFSPSQSTVTEDLLSGKLFGRAWQTVGRWLGSEPQR